MVCKICYGVATRDVEGIHSCRACGSRMLTSTIVVNKQGRKVARAKGAISIGYPTVRAKLKSGTVDAN